MTDPAGIVPSALTPEGLATLQSAFVQEQTKRASQNSAVDGVYRLALSYLSGGGALADLTDAINRAAANVTPVTPPTPTASDFTPGNVYGPGAMVNFGGSTYQNISGAYLTASPTDYPNGWAKQGVTASAWAAGVAYKTGDQVTYQGVTYQCLQGHTSQTGWEPPNATSLWKAI